MGNSFSLHGHAGSATFCQQVSKLVKAHLLLQYEPSCGWITQLTCISMCRLVFHFLPFLSYQSDISRISSPSKSHRNAIRAIQTPAVGANLWRGHLRNLHPNSAPQNLPGTVVSYPNEDRRMRTRYIRAPKDCSSTKEFVAPWIAIWPLLPYSGNYGRSDMRSRRQRYPRQ